MRLITLLLFHIASIPPLFGQQDHNLYVEKSINMNFVGGVALGIQGIAIPPYTHKLSAGIEYTIGRGSIYALPGISAGIAPVIFFHFETGIGYRFMTIDYSTNYYEIEENEVVRSFSNGNINLGIRFKLNKKRQRNLFLWIKAGKSISEKGYDDEFPPIWNGYNVEVRIVYKVFKLFKK
ncbi:hypothetical protein [uncultured Aquimarina sp.]|uniref:hypothetical protein n=1 Tax=uncultured Aquimarina sp. TaxID=575652 RepID=UPI00262AC39C|nr:hypothetical protein [uncultured Aquimarina sp.]